MKQVKSLVEAKNVLNRKLSETTQNSDGDVPYTSLLTNECILETILNNEGNYVYRNKMWVGKLTKSVCRMFFRLSKGLKTTLPAKRLNAHYY